MTEKTWGGIKTEELQRQSSIYGKDYDFHTLIKEMQVMIGEISTEEELCHSVDLSREEYLSNPLSWTIVGVRKDGILYDINKNPVHRQMMALYFKQQEIKNDFYKLRQEQDEYLRKRIVKNDRRNVTLKGRVKKLENRITAFSEKYERSKKNREDS